MQTSYRLNMYIPPLVEKSKKLADKYQFKHSCSDEAGRLLSVLAGQVKQGTILEVGTGFGVGSAWILSAISPAVHLISVDTNEDKICAVGNLLQHSQASFIHGDWKDILANGPFPFIFADAAAAKTVEAQHLFEALAMGGMLLMDDFTPEEHFPVEWQGKPDLVRAFWLNHEDLLATEIYLSPTSAAILATRCR